MQDENALIKTEASYISKKHNDSEHSVKQLHE